MKRAAGFTLLEVLVALAVLAITMGAIIGIATQSVNTFGYLRDQTFAGWVAANQIDELLLDAEPWPQEGGRKGSAELANRNWFWETRFRKTADPDLTELEIQVRASEGGPVLSKQVAFKSRPPEDEPATDDPAAPPADVAPAPQPAENSPPSPRAHPSGIRHP
ncbi:MAG: type II secretion system minor pseudopilin GspI [Candidatus Competibacteraceae bacterium]|nr:type II secretion system minor pseudopilin GspI [Candidatus Competibacteraceae bacterium]